MFFLVSKKLAWVALPWVWAAALLVLAFLARRRRALAAALALSACVTLGALAFPPAVNALGGLLSASGTSTMDPEIEYDVAIVLGGHPARDEAGADVVRRGRARHVLYSGALGPAGVARRRAGFIARGVPADRIVIESRSRNTRENAVESARVVAAHGWRTVLIVTSAPHVERAAGCFRRVGLRPDVLAVDAAPLRGRRPRTLALRRSAELLHEVIGRAVYRLVGYSAPWPPPLGEELR
jgi:uncharacterized SAM-binding protein YcdF (DUF218 family)